MTAPAPDPIPTPPNPPATIALLQTNSLTMAVQQEVERAILAGDHAPGDRLNEAALALRLGVSRGPVREAFRMLEEAGLVRTEKNRGVFVRAIPIDEAVEIFELRATMEELVGRRLAGTLTPGQQQQLESIVQEMEDAVGAADTHRYHRLNLQFHDTLVELAGNRKLASLYRKLVKEISLFRRLNLDGSNVLPVSAQAHWEILEAVKSGDPERAGRALFDHAMQSKARTIANADQRRANAAPKA